MWNEIVRWITKRDGLNRLLAINIVLFVLVQVVLIFQRLSEISIVPSDLYLAAGAGFRGLVQRPWSVFTHMFVHVEVGHFIFNIFCLYTAGKLFRHFLGDGRLVVNYILGGMFGYLLYLGMAMIFPKLTGASYILGASASIMSIILTIGSLQPNYQIKLFGVFDMKLIWLCGIIILVDLISLRKGFNSGGHMAHLGGAIFGVIYAYQYKRGVVMGSWLENFFNRIGSFFSGNKTSYTEHRRPKSDEEFNAEKKKRQQRVDQILDKISKSGYESLSKEEKDFLFKYSQK
jgi:membrane associated rhomboid family serine protease